jgi:hypothetical protein
MAEKLIIFCWFFGGFTVAFICLLIATILAVLGKPSRILKRFCFVLAFCGLVYEGGCFAIASSFNRAFGGGAGNDKMNNILGFAFLIGMVWSVVIISITSADEDKQKGEKKRPNK